MTKTVLYVEDLLEALKACTKEYTVLTSSTDFYARSGDTQNAYLDLIDPGLLAVCLEGLIEHEV